MSLFVTPLILLAHLAFAGGSTASKPAASKVAAFPSAATVATADGLTLQASYGQPAKPSTNGVVFVHMNGRSKEDWAGLADACWHAGSWVVTVDLRGMGANVPAGGVAAPLTPDDYQKMTQDVNAAVAFLRGKGVTKVTLVGAELGANLAINAAADDAAVVDTVLLSPGMVYQGVIATDAVKRYGARPLLMVASADDAYAAQSVSRFDQLASGDKHVEMYETAGKGTRMLNRQPELEGYVVGWIGTHWAPAEAKPSAAPSSAPPAGK